MKISKIIVSSSLANCFKYLINNILEEGRFVYEINSETGLVLDRYNILRHAGSLYAMYQALPLCLHEKEKSLQFLKKGMDYLTRQLKPLGRNQNILCVVENNEAKLGGTALTLLALVEQYKVSPNLESVALMKMLANFLVQMQNLDGSFRSKIIFDESNDTSFISIYYPGEAILALTNLYTIDPHSQWLKAAEMGANYLLANPVKDKWLPRGHNHWFAMALGELYYILPKKEYREELNLIVQSTVLSAHNNIFGLPNQTKPSKPFSSAAMATRGEAIMAGILLESKLKNYKLVDEWLPIVEEILAYCINLQINENENVPNNKIIGGIKKSVTNQNIRIDYVQHSMAVMIGFLTLQN